MTTELFPDDYFGNLNDFNLNENIVREQKWLIDEIIKPDLPNIVENTKKCLDLLTSEQTFKMPVSNGHILDNSNGNRHGPSIRGIISRRREFIIDFQVWVKFPQFHKNKPVLYKMKNGTEFNLLQISLIIVKLREILELLEDLQQCEDIYLFVEGFRKVVELLSKSINLLQNPPNELLFPTNDNLFIKQMFEDPYTLCESTHHLMSMELVLFKNEVTIDFRNLSKVTRKPWCDIDFTTNESFVDKLRNKLKCNRTMSIAQILKEEGLKLEDSTFMNNILSNLNSGTTTMQQAQEYLNRCITFDGKVVTEREKVSITTSDPNLITISTKLYSLENLVTNHLTNLAHLNL